MWDWVHAHSQSINFGFPKSRNPGIALMYRLLMVVGAASMFQRLRRLCRGCMLEVSTYFVSFPTTCPAKVLTDHGMCNMRYTKQLSLGQ